MDELTNDSRLDYIDPRKIYGDELESWEGLWDYDLSLYQNVYNLAAQCVVLPFNDILMPIACTYLLIPSKWAKVLPILFSYGQKGTGKSTFAMLAAKLHGQSQLFSAADTFASLRNALDSMRWINPEDKEFEKDGAILCWDNIHADTLKRDNRILQMLLFGYNRNSERISIAGTDGTNKEYFVFSPKIISSVEPLHLMSEFEELKRRLLVIKHKQFEQFTLAEKASVGTEFNIATDRLELDSIDWEGIENQFFLFWNDLEHCKEYARWRSLLTRRGKKSFTVPKSVKGENWIISVDIICTGLLVGTWQNLPEALEAIGCYWEWYHDNVKDSESATLLHLQHFIEEEAGEALKRNVMLEANGFDPDPIWINAEKLKRRIEYHQSKGELDITPKTGALVRLMNSLGWTLKDKGWIQIR